MSLQSDNALMTVELQRQRDELLAACQAFIVYHEDNTDGDDVATMLNYAEAKDKIFAAVANATRKPEPETEYQKVIRTGVRPAIWPPILMTSEELLHFRAAHGIVEPLTNAEMIDETNFRR